MDIYRFIRSVRFTKCTCFSKNFFLKKSNKNVNLKEEKTLTI